MYTRNLLSNHRILLREKYDTDPAVPLATIYFNELHFLLAEVITTSLIKIIFVETNKTTVARKIGLVNGIYV